MTFETIFTILVALADAATTARALLRPHREPASRLAWIAAILALPILGALLYVLVGETRISGRRRSRGKQVDARLPRPAGNYERPRQASADPHWAAFRLAATVNKLPPTTGNHASLAGDSNIAIDQMVADIDAAQDTAHGCFYIWLDDSSGLKLSDAFMRAAQRGVRVRLLADALGSRHFIRSEHWRKLIRSGCEPRAALPVGNPIWTWIRGRIDLRNHRKLLVIDNAIAWCGSQNCADPEFRIKARFGPWVDIMSRWRGPVVPQCQFLFVSDWLAEGGDDISKLLEVPAPDGDGPIVAQVLGTGPNAEFDAMPACFAELIHSARDELVITTPYFVPDEQLLFALTSAARRGVRTLLVLPKRNDSWIVAGASRSYYKDLIDAGVEIHEFVGGLLHAKTMVIDRCVCLIGSANLDRRSFELNFENNILFEDATFASRVRARQDDYLAHCSRVVASQVDDYSLLTLLWQNLLATLSPVL